MLKGPTAVDEFNLTRFGNLFFASAYHWKFHTEVSKGKLVPMIAFEAGSFAILKKLKS